MNIIYNGEIYLKRGPEIIDPRNSIEYQIRTIKRKPWFK